MPDAQTVKALYARYYNFGGSRGGLYERCREALFNSRVYNAWLRIDGDISFHAAQGSGLLLDIGCNEGRGLTRYRSSGFQPEGVEVNPVAAEWARRRGFLVHEVPLELVPKHRYRVAVLSQVLEHSLDPALMLRTIRDTLLDDGELWLSTPNSRSWQRSLFGSRWINWHPPFHTVLYDQRCLTGLLASHGFTIASVSSATPSLWMAQSTIAALRSREGSPTRALRNAPLVALLTLAIRLLLFPALWLGDYLGRGDCLLVVARKSAE